MDNPEAVYTDEHGRMRVSGTRVLLDLVVYAYNQGETPEHNVQMYPSLTLERLYYALGYYLHNREHVDAYIKRMDEESERIHQDIEARYPRKLTQADLKARLQPKQNDIR